MPDTTYNDEFVPSGDGDGSDEDKGLNPEYMDFVSPVIAISLMASGFLLILPQSTEAVAVQLQAGNIRWMATALTGLGTVSAFFTSRRSFVEILVDAVASVVTCGWLTTLLLSRTNPFRDPVLDFRSGSVEIFAVCYFVVIGSLLAPSFVIGRAKLEIMRILDGLAKAPKHGGQRAPGFD
jgi:hypothetical protein